MCLWWLCFPGGGTTGLQSHPSNPCVCLSVCLSSPRTVWWGHWKTLGRKSLLLFEAHTKKVCLIWGSTVTCPGASSRPASGASPLKCTVYSHMGQCFSTKRWWHICVWYRCFQSSFPIEEAQLFRSKYCSPSISIHPVLSLCRQLSGFRLPNKSITHSLPWNLWLFSMWL